MIDIQNSEDLLTFIVTQSKSGNKAWFGFQQQRIVGIYMCYEMAKIHGDKMSADEIVEYVIGLNNAVFKKMIKVDGSHI